MDETLNALLAVADAMAQELQEFSDEHGWLPATEALIADYEQVKRELENASE